MIAPQRAGRRVAITGVGIVSPLGTTASHFDALIAGRSAVRASDDPDVRALQALEARVCGLDPRARISNRVVRKILPAASAYAVIAAGEALADAGLSPDDPARARCGLYAGSVRLDVDFNLFVPAVRQSLHEGDFDLQLFARRGMKELDPLFLVKALPNGGLCAIAIEHRILGPNVSLTNGACGGLQAVILAADAIRSGTVSQAVAGGFDSLVSTEERVEHYLAGRLSRRVDVPAGACRPFDTARDGYVVGEAAAFVVLEDEALARARGATIHGHVLGGGHAAERPGEMPERAAGVALAQAARRALRHARLAPETLEAHFGDGLATEADDLAEADAALSLEGARPLFTAATGAVGYTGAAAGALSFAHAALARRRNIIPPIVNCAAPDPRCPLRFATSSCEGGRGAALIWTRDRWARACAVVIGV